VEEVLAETTSVASSLLRSFRKTSEERDARRQDLLKHDMLLADSALGYPPIPTTCGADGSYAIERLLTTDLVAAAAVVVEGLTPPSEKRHWEEPHHRSFVAAEPHLEDTATVLRAVMLGEELRLATSAPHDLVMIDGTMTLPIIYFNQALNKAPQVTRLRCAQTFLEHCGEYLEAYCRILQPDRSDKHYVALPKYSTRREIGLALGWPESHDDRGLLTLILNPGELTRPRPLEQPEQDWHLNTSRIPEVVKSRVDRCAQQIINSLTRVQVFYYKPHDWLPALRVEVAESVAANTHQLATVVQGLKHQCAVASMLEPYPIYLADRMVKALARAIPAFRQVTTQHISEGYDGEVGDIFFAMHGYRSDSGR